jgi:N-acetyl-gamma-glutamyl-phosphate reductase
VRVTFVPHLLPTLRGIATSVYVRPRGDDRARARARCATPTTASRSCACCPRARLPSLQAVRRHQLLRRRAVEDAHNDTWILLSTLDNLCKGASGQAVQCANAMCGIPETTGLLDTALLP